MIERDSQQRRDHHRHRPPVVQHPLELGVGKLEPHRIEREVAAVVEHAAEEGQQPSVRAFARLVRDPRLPALRQIVGEPVEPRQRPCRRRVRGKPREHGEPLLDEVAGQRPVAVQRHAPRPPLGVDHLERDLRPIGGLGAELGGGVGGERLEDRVQATVAHGPRFQRGRSISCTCAMFSTSSG